MTITALPTPPSRTDAPATFITKADAFIAALPQFVTETNAQAAAFLDSGISDTSASSNSIGTGAKTFTVSSAKGYQPGMYLIIADAVAPSTNSMYGQVTSYSGTTLMVNILSVTGSGTKTTWAISQSTVGGATSSSNTFTGLQTFAVGANIASAATVDLTAATGNTLTITGTTTVTAFTMTAGQQMELIAAGALPLTYHATTMNINGGVSYTCAAGDRLFVNKAADNVVRVNVVKQDGTAVVDVDSLQVPVRQTVLSGPVDSSGLPNFVGSTGSTTVTASGTLIATAANGFDAIGAVNRIGSILNPSWTGLSSNGTMYLYLDIAADGTCTTGSTILEPTYRFGGADVTTNGQFTFNIQEMQGKVGNGSVATQTYRVFVGEVTVAGSVVTAITWYALMGRYDSGYTNTLVSAGSSYSKNHNIGTSLVMMDELIECITTEHNYSVGDILINTPTANASNVITAVPAITRNTYFNRRSSGGVAYVAVNKNTGAQSTLTAANWKYKVVGQRSF